MTKRYVVVGAESEIPEGEARVFEAEDQRVVVCRMDGRLYAIEDVCTHDEGPLGEGFLLGHEIECPRHGARFDIRTGEVRRMPAVVPIRTFPLKLEGNKVLVEIETE